MTFSKRATISIILVLGCIVQAFAQNRPDALRAFREGDYLRSVAICQAEIADNPNNLESHVVISWALIALNRLDDAMSYALAGRRISRYDTRITLSLGEISYLQGLNEEAVRHFREYITRVPEGTRMDRVYYLLGETYIRLGQFRHADIALTTAVHWLPGNAAWWTRLAYAREGAGDLREAVTAYERALALSFQHGDAQRGLERVRRTLSGR